MAPVNNRTAFVVVLPRPHPEVATAEIRASAAPNAPVVVHAKVVGQRAFLPLITPGPPVKVAIVDRGTAVVVLRDRAGRALLTAPIVRRWDMDPMASWPPDMPPPF